MTTTIETTYAATYPEALEVQRVKRIQYSGYRDLAVEVKVAYGLGYDVTVTVTADEPTCDGTSC